MPDTPADILAWKVEYPPYSVGLSVVTLRSTDTQAQPLLETYILLP